MHGPRDERSRRKFLPVSGPLTGELKFSHALIMGEKFCRTWLTVARSSKVFLKHLITRNRSGKSTLYSGMGIQFHMEFSVFQFHSQSHFWVKKFHIPIPNPVIALWHSTSRFLILYLRLEIPCSTIPVHDFSTAIFRTDFSVFPRRRMTVHFGYQ